VQKAYITALYDIMLKDKNVLSLLSDSGTDYDIMMARDLPAQCFNFGIAEQNKVAAASGMAALGKIPFVYTTNSFIAYRAYEFVRNDICAQRRNVKLMGMGTGISAWGTLGHSHHTTEDIAALRAIPNLTLLSAATPLELQHMVRFAYETAGPVYVRLGMSAEEELFSDTYVFRPGKPVELLNAGTDITIFVTGTIAGNAFHAAERLHDNGVRVSLYNMPTLKPVDNDAVLDRVGNSKIIFTVEEHSVNGGLGGVIAEILAETGAATPLVRIGLDDRFAKGYGRTDEIRKLNDLDVDGVYSRIINKINQLEGTV
jgi:transketolase